MWRTLFILFQGGAVTYDDVLGLLGEFGRYQKWICLLLCIPAVSGGMQILLTVFTLAVPDHRSVHALTARATRSLQICVITTLLRSNVTQSFPLIPISGIIIILLAVFALAVARDLWSVLLLTVRTSSQTDHVSEQLLLLLPLFNFFFFFKVFCLKSFHMCDIRLILQLSC